MAIAAAFQYHFELSVSLIIIASVLDRADGILARRYDAATAFGKEFDSLSDLVSFGVAPAVLLYGNMTDKWHPAGLVCFAFFTLCGAYRLARFNVSSGTTYFQGVPITVAGAVLAVLVILLRHFPAAILAAGIIASLAMISTIRIPKI
jgi:CDP-diacylglycerol--serine O-phosphatidyltransferase